MFHRNSLSITAVFFCHLLLAPNLVTSQLHPGSATEAQAQASSPYAASKQNPFPPATQASGDSEREEVTIHAREQEKDHAVYKLRGDVEIDFRSLIFRGDEVTYDSATGDVTAKGHLTLDGGPNDEHIEASHGTFNIRTETGEFFDVVGTTGVRVHGPHVTLTSSAPFTFTGKKVEKTGPSRYVLYDGSITACELPRPKWTFNAAKIIVEVGGEARLYNGNFRIEKVPVIYLPYAQHPVDTLGRGTGFLIPTIGTSSVKGLVLGDSFYWAINRSADATVGAEYFSKRGWAEHGDFRWRPSEDSFLKARYFGVLDRGVPPLNTNQGGEDVTLDGAVELPYGFRGVSSIEYLSSFVFRLAFTEGFSQTVNSEVKSNIFASKTVNGFSFNSLFARYQNFQSTTPGDVVTILHLPTFDISSVDRRIGNSPLYWSFDTAAEGLSRSQPGFVTPNMVGRLDLYPRLSLPVFFRGWTLRPDVGVRETYYSARLNPTSTIGAPVSNDVNRKALLTSMEIRPPSMSRIFDHPVFGHKLKHVVEPRVTYEYVSGVDNFANIIRFDDRDILSDTNDVEYSLVQRLYAKRMAPKGCDNGGSSDGDQEDAATSQRAPASGDCAVPSAREVISWELKQKYFLDETFGGALVNGKRNVFTATDEFTGIAFLTSPRRLSPLVSRMHVHPTNNTDVTWQVDYDTLRGRINASTTLLNYRVGDIFAGAGHAYLLVPGELASDNPVPLTTPIKFNQYRLMLGYGNPNKRGVNAAINVGFDANLSFLQYAAFQSSYNWDCCGLSFEYRRYALGSVRNENQYRFAFTLANIGTFGNMKRQDRIF